MTVRVERGKAANLDQAFYVDGTLTNASGAVTVTITRADGTVLATDAATTNPSVGVYRYALVPQANLDRLTLTYTGTWSGAVQTETTTVEIVGDFYLTLAELRAMPNLSETAKFTDAKLTDARTWFETAFEDYTGVAWVPRYRRVRLDGSGGSTLILPDLFVRTIRSVRTHSTASTYTAFTSTELADLVIEDSGVLRRFDGAAFTRGARNLWVEYEHGFDRPPADVVTAAKRAIRLKLLDEQTGPRHYAVQTEIGLQRNYLTGADKPFEDDKVNEVANRRYHRLPGVAS